MSRGGVVTGPWPRDARAYGLAAVLAAGALAGCAHAGGERGRWSGPAQEAALSVALGAVVGAGVAVIEAGDDGEPLDLRTSDSGD